MFWGNFRGGSMMAQTQQELRASALRSYPGGKAPSNRRPVDNAETRPDMEDANTSYTDSLTGPFVCAIQKMYPSGAMVGNGDIAPMEPPQMDPLGGRHPSKASQKPNPLFAHPLPPPFLLAPVMAGLWEICVRIRIKPRSSRGLGLPHRVYSNPRRQNVFPR